MSSLIPVYAKDNEGNIYMQYIDSEEKEIDSTQWVSISIYKAEVAK